MGCKIYEVMGMLISVGRVDWEGAEVKAFIFPVFEADVSRY